jgi:hypothetical protein
MKPLCLALCLCTTPAFAIETCEKDLRVTTAEGLEARIIGGPVAEMCVIHRADGNMLPVPMASLTLSTTAAAPQDVRSITAGQYNCLEIGAQSDQVVMALQMNEDMTYDIAQQGGGGWKAYDDLTIQFLDGPLKNSFVDAQNGAMAFIAAENHPRMLCQRA